ncbi:MAG: GMC family oxidoreductase N-terminal domain-containing protein [Nocardioidaceae bacterium]|nr:GMC family oxidoreductase N-terminal domain-containing protein [Nocardioidaceae bacterium]
MGSYDYIVVGSGSAGAVVASRLSEDPNISVLLLEAGGSHRNMNVQIPAAFAKQFKTKRDWDIVTEPEPHLGGREIYHPRGKMLGGCSSMNAMMYIRGNRYDYDSWARSGATGWSYDEVLPLFKRSEDNSRGASEYHSTGGPLHISDQRHPNPIGEKMIEAMGEVGIPRNDDFNGAEQAGAGFAQVTQYKGRRWTTADAFLTPARKRRNLTVLTKTQARKLRIEGGRVVGIEVQHGSRQEIHEANREVILSAGAFNTPQLLMLSGIGPADHLREHGIAVNIDNPNVGAHLMDHPLYLNNFETSMKGTLAEAESPQQLLKFFTQGQGLLTSNVAEIGCFFHTRSDQVAPDMEIIGAPAYFWDNGFAEHDSPAYTIALSLVGSQSRGHVRLRSADPLDKVAPTFNYLAEQADVEALIVGVERAREIAAAASLRAVTTRELHPGPGIKSHAEVEAEIREQVIHTYHPSCTARIGTEADGVVDPQLRVHGIEGLRVADASVFPTITHGNTHAPTVMVGEKAAEMIRTNN